MREKLQRFMTGRHGADELGRTLNIVVLVSLVVSMFSGLLPVLSVFYWFGIALMMRLTVFVTAASEAQQNKS